MRMTQAAAVAETPKETPKDASASVIAQHAATLKALPFSDTRDFDEAARGFLGTIENAKVSSPQGRTVWSLEPYAFLNEETAPPTVDPSLWRQSRLNMNHGLFEVVPGVYQVRGLDIANMTLIEGDKGVVVVDTLTSIEGARAAMELYFQHRGKRPVSAVEDQKEIRDVKDVFISTARDKELTLLFDPGASLEERIFAEQFLG